MVKMWIRPDPPHSSILRCSATRENYFLLSISQNQPYANTIWSVRIHICNTTTYNVNDSISSYPGEDASQGGGVESRGERAEVGARRNPGSSQTKGIYRILFFSDQKNGIQGNSTKYNYFCDEENWLRSWCEKSSVTLKRNKIRISIFIKSRKWIFTLD